MNVLMLCGEIPYPPHGGSRMRVFQFLRGLAPQHRLTLLAYQYEAEEEENARDLERYCRVERVLWQEPEGLARLRTAPRWRSSLAHGRGLVQSPYPWVAQYFALPSMKRALAGLLHQEPFDLIHVEDTAMAALLPAGPIPPVLQSIQNLESLRAKRERRSGLGDRIDLWKLERFEKRACERAALCCPTSSIEADEIRQLAPRASIQVVPNGVDTTEFSPEMAEAVQATVVFTGTLSYEPNAEGISWFVRQVWPKIAQEVPGAHLDIVGREPPETVQALASEQVTVTGQVPDVRPYLQCAWVSVAPLLQGGGTRLKILEAMACARPVVSTRRGAEGLDVTPEANILIGDSPDDLARQVLRLLQSTSLRRTIGDQGRALVEREYDWGRITDGLGRAYSGLMKRDLEVARSLTAAPRGHA